MKAIIITWHFVFLSIAVSLRVKPKVISLRDFLKRIDDITEATRERETGSVKWHHKNERIQDDSRSGKQKEDGKVVKLDMMYCQPYPSIVQVPEPADWSSFYMPSFVKLHRCAGGCHISPSKLTATGSGLEIVSVLPKSERLERFPLKCRK
ncbi:uncharacterized protein LOC144662305 [Oculina patagonica]